MSSGMLWFVTALILALDTFGFVRIVYLCLYILCFIAGCIVMLCDHGQKEMNSEGDGWLREHLPTSPKVRAIYEQYSAKDGVKIEKDNRLTGSSAVDDRLHECVEFFMKDYVKYWYNDLSDDEEFLHHFRNCLHDFLRAFAMRCKSVDWQLYLTRNLVDVLASHMKLFRKAEEKRKRIQEPPSVVELFFENEIALKKVCHDLVACDEQKKTDYLQDICEVLLYILLPKEEFHCKPFMYLMRESLVNGVFMPMFRIYSDPDYLNQYVSWLISDNCVSSEWFLFVLGHKALPDELRSVRDKAEEEITKLSAKDTVGDDVLVKQELNSMRYMKNFCERQLRKQNDGSNYIYNGDYELENYKASGNQLYDLPLSMVLRSNIALQMFIEYMQSVNGQAYLFFWLTVDGYRASAEQQLNEVKAQQSRGSLHRTPDKEMLRTIGVNIYDQYLSKRANPRVVLGDGALDKQIKKKLDSGEPSPYMFDDIQQKVFTLMQLSEKFYPAFKASSLYLKLLAELDLLVQPSLNSNDNNDSISTSSLDDNSSIDIEDTSKLTASITQTGICSEHGKTYALYAITVTRSWMSGKTDSWDTFRRYREFNDLHQSLKENGSNLGNLGLPGKTFFKDLKEEFLEKRRLELNKYLTVILSMEHPPKSMECLHTFLDAKAYQKSSHSFARKVDSMMRLSVKNVTNFMTQAPDNLIDGLQKASDKMSDGLQKFSDKFPSSAEQNGDVPISEQLDNNIPLGILLLLMDEVFDLKQRNQWLRRQIVTALQQIMRTLFGDRMNRKIVDYVDNAVSAEQVAGYIQKLMDALWPCGTLAEATPERNEQVVMRTRVLTKAKLHGVIPDELRPLVGSDTSRRGVMRVFELIQHKELNTTLCCVLLEGLLCEIFPRSRLPELFTAFHSASPKARSLKFDLSS
ncbi:unnamed protein product [Clavelina lepadiformis]|uniref:Sorting nexin-13 n=1 Tax=Clavelina lepadiformis TaxID=159417 RepID=A0ABP0F3R4_CLALP